MNVAAFEAISGACDVNYVGPINPAPIYWEKVLSKVLRSSKFGGSFFYFSDRRLKKIAEEAATGYDADADFDFFHGFTPWIMTNPDRPYFAWSDCTFHDYIDIYHDRAAFDAADIGRIERLEQAWLRGAQKVMFTSQWAADRAVSHYQLDPDRIERVGIFGEMELPGQDRYSGGRAFAFVSTNFAAKGGHEVLKAFEKVRASHPVATLTIVGDAPADLKDMPGIECVGYLRKESQEEYRRLQAILGSARAVVHPTRSDISPLLIVEAGYFGCPVISTRRFAIPELIDDGRTGFLLDDPQDVDALASLMDRVLADDGYDAMRRAAWDHARLHHTKAAFASRLRSQLGISSEVSAR